MECCRYFMNADMEKHYDVDMEAIKQYFPLEVLMRLHVPLCFLPQ